MVSVEEENPVKEQKRSKDEVLCGGNPRATDIDFRRIVCRSCRLTRILLSSSYILVHSEGTLDRYMIANGWPKGILHMLFWVMRSS